MRAIVCGGRDYDDSAAVWRTLDDLDITDVAHGGATGADALADRWATERGTWPACYPADWTGPCRPPCRPGHRKPRRGGGTYCPAAGNYRNQWMLDDFSPEAVVAFPGGSGTADMVRRAEAAGVRVIRA